MRLHRASLLLVASGAFLASLQGAKADNLFDAFGSLFGGGRQEAAPPVQESAPPMFSDQDGALGVTVHNRRKRAVRTTRVEPTRSSPINPVERPNWYLEDPTLRPGDIVVLSGKTLVFEGGSAPHVRADFSSVSETRLLSKTEKQTVKTLASLPAADGPTVPANTVASLTR